MRLTYYKEDSIVCCIKQNLICAYNALIIQLYLKDVLQVLMVDWPSKYGEIFCSYIGPNWNVNISSPELMEVTLKLKN